MADEFYEIAVGMSDERQEAVALAVLRRVGTYWETVRAWEPNSTNTAQFARIAEYAGELDGRKMTGGQLQSCKIDNDESPDALDRLLDAALTG